MGQMSSLPLKWHGGKQYLAAKILGLFPPRDSYVHYVEPFFGGGAVLFSHDPEGKSEVVNDINYDLTEFW
jgi:DNA adenine methylase